MEEEKVHEEFHTPPGSELEFYEDILDDSKQEVLSDVDDHEKREVVDVIKANRRVVVATKDYIARRSTELTFSEGEEMEILDDSDPDWAEALVSFSSSYSSVLKIYFDQVVCDRIQGLVPKSHVKEAE